MIAQVPIIEVQNLYKTYSYYEQTPVPQVAKQGILGTISNMVQRVTNGKLKAKSERDVLTDISFSVNESETVGIIGRNGCAFHTHADFFYFFS